MKRRRSAQRSTRTARIALVRIAGMHRRASRYFHCARLAEIEAMYIHVAEQMSTCMWGPPKPVETVAVRIPRSLKRMLPNGLRVLK